MVVDAQLVKAEFKAQIEVRFRFPLKNHIPRVFCHEPWMKTGDEWHNSTGSGLCWALEQEWLAAQSWTGKSLQLVTEEGVRWLVNDAGNLIARHWVAAQMGATKWSSDWDYWKHGHDGVVQYQKENNSGEKAPTNWSLDKNN